MQGGSVVAAALNELSSPSRLFPGGSGLPGYIRGGAGAEEVCISPSTESSRIHLALSTSDANGLFKQGKWVNGPLLFSPTPRSGVYTLPSLIEEKTVRGITQTPVFSLFFCFCFGTESSSTLIKANQPNFELFIRTKRFFAYKKMCYVLFMDDAPRRLEEDEKRLSIHRHRGVQIVAPSGSFVKH